jgi:hypothetical protein
VVALLLPNDFSFLIGPLRFSPYRLLLVLYVPFALVRFLSGAAGPLRLSDWCALFGSSWIMVAMVANEGFLGIESGGITFIESFGGFLIARMSIRTAADWRQATKIFGIGIALVAPFAIAECVTGKHIIRDLASAVVGSAFFGADIADRFGLTRAYGPFDHPILQGVVSATVAISAWHAWKGLVSWRTMIWPLCMGGAMSSISSGAMATIACGALLSAWSIAASFMVRKWRAFIIFAVMGYFLVSLMSNRSGMAVLLSYFTFSSATAYHRMIIWEHGFHYNAIQNPIFGLGDRDWVRPGWMGSSMDNYFLFNMVFYGFPCFLAIALSIILKVRAAALATARSAYPHLLMSWWIPMVAITVAGCTVHFWNQVLVFFWFFLGGGSWCEGEPGAGGRRRA